MDNPSMEEVSSQYIEITRGDIVFRANNWKDLGSLFAKIAAVTGDMKTVERSAKHQQGWTYAPWDKISQAVNESLGNNHLAMITSMVSEPTQETLQAAKQGGGTYTVLRCYVTIDVVLGDGETGAMAFARWYGQADDTSGGEKAIDKALTYAAKSFVKKLFVVSTGEDDPEGTDSGADPATSSRNKPPRQQPTPKAQQQPTPAPKAQQPSPLTPEPDEPPFEATKPPAPVAKAPEELPANVTPLRNQASFFAEALRMGYERADVKLILGYYGEQSYAEAKHVELIEKLKAWKALRDAMVSDLADPNDELLDDTVLAEMTYLGLKDAAVGTTINLHNVTLALPMHKKHRAFTRKAQEVGKGMTLAQIAGALKEAGLLPWRPEKEEMMLKVVSELAKFNQEDIVEQDGKVEEVIAGAPEIDPFDDGTGEPQLEVIVVPSGADVKDLFDDMFGGGIQS